MGLKDIFGGSKKPPPAREWGRAAYEGNLRKIKSLLARGADIDQLNSYGYTALCWAAIGGRYSPDIKLMQCLIDNGAAEAVIAGGALRDLFNQRAVRDVDIFLKGRGGKEENRKFLQEAFAAVGLDITPQVIGYRDGYGWDTI